MKRKICWPNPDATCLEGGCVHCDSGQTKTLEQVRRYVETVLEVPDRCGDTFQLANKAFDYGVRHGLYQ